MGKVTGFLEFERRDRGYDKPDLRRKSWREFVKPLPDAELGNQAARCMDCGVPFCHEGCPVNNLIPDWNNLVYRGQWLAALETLHSTNNFPEFTGRICPAPCEASCTLNIDDNPVTIKSVECQIVDRGWEEGWVQPQPPARRSGKRVAARIAMTDDNRPVMNTATISRILPLVNGRRLPRSATAGAIASAADSEPAVRPATSSSTFSATTIAITCRRR